MARPLRVEFSGAVYHITSRGNERRDIFVSDEDGASLIELRDAVGQLLPRVDLPEALLEIEACTRFATAFTHMLGNATRQSRISHEFVRGIDG